MPKNIHINFRITAQIIILGVFPFLCNFCTKFWKDQRFIPMVGKAYDSLILNGYTHYRVYHNANEFTRGKSHVNGIECLWSYAKKRMSKFNRLTGVVLHLKESECRYNHRFDDFAGYIRQNLLR